MDQGGLRHGDGYNAGGLFRATPAQGGCLARRRIIAKAGFNRWLVPPAALAIHLCIGMAYGFSVFWLPLQTALSRAAGTPVAACAGKADTFGEKLSGTLHALTATNCEWTQFDLGWMFTLFFVLLGTSAAIWGGWLEKAGPRKAGVVAAFCWCGGMVISALGVYLHQLWMLWLGSGVIGGIGLGLGYISPVSTLIKWFPDKRGMATGMAIMGFGGGALIGSPLAALLINGFSAPIPSRAPMPSRLQDRHDRWRLGDLPGAGGHLFRVHAGRRVRLPPAAGALEAQGMGAEAEWRRR